MLIAIVCLIYISLLHKFSGRLPPVKAHFPFRLRNGDADDLDILLRLLLVTLRILNLVHNIHTTHRAAKYSVLAIKPRLIEQSASHPN